MSLSNRELKILLAEDNLVNQKVATSLLKKQGYVSKVANNGREAISLWQQEEFDLVLMDIQMPEMSGFEATQRIRELEKTKGDHIPIIAVTAHAMKGDREKCIESGMDHYVTKPINPQKLFEAIESFFPSDQNEQHNENNISNSAACVFDRQAILERVGGDEDLMKEIISMFVEECPKMMAEIESAVSAKNSEGLERAAHSLKGSVSNFGAQRAYEAAYALEKMGHDGSIDQAAGVFSQLKNEINTLSSSLQSS